jgi:glyoxylase-like metal-dependent hydrolase (beta-lactamase superfamily II)
LAKVKKTQQQAGTHHPGPAADIVKQERKQMTFQTETFDVKPFSPEELYRKLQQREPLFVLDVRNPEAAEQSPIEGPETLSTLNIPYYDFLEDEDANSARIPTDRPVFVVCAKAQSSQYVANVLQERGAETYYLEGGMAKWGDFYDVRDVINQPYGRIVQVARPARGDLSFMLISDGQAAVIDPLRHTEQYTTIANEAHASMVHIFDTHAHADHISGGPALAAETGAPYYLHPYDAIHPMDMLPARMPYTPLSDGQHYEVGQFRVEVIGFPGHTLGQVNFLVTAPDDTTYLFSGDGIFLRSFGRPDLGGKGETWTPILYESMFERLPRHINDDTLILPAHFSTLDEGGTDGIYAATYREVREQNDGLAPRSRDEFINYVLGHLPTFPEQYVEIKRVNVGLVEPSDEKASELETGKNVCALSD